MNYNCPFTGLFFLDRGKHHCHTLAFKYRHILCPSVLLELHRETKKLLLTLLGELDRTSPEEDSGLDLGSFLEEALRVAELELEVVLVGVGAETDLLDHDLGGILLHLLRLLPLLVEILLVVEYLANGRLRLCAYLHEVELEEYGRAENMPVLEGKRMTMMIAPNKKK